MSYISKAELQRRLAQQRRDLAAKRALPPQPITATLESFQHNTFWVFNWRAGWKWISTWMLALIVFINTVPVPPDVIAALPPHWQHGVSVVLAIIGFIGRFINQHRNAEVINVDPT